MEVLQAASPASPALLCWGSLTCWSKRFSPPQRSLGLWWRLPLPGCKRAGRHLSMFTRHVDALERDTES